MCARPPGHLGKHVSASGLFSWSDGPAFGDATAAQIGEQQLEQR